MSKQIAGCSKDVEEARSQIQIELRSKVERTVSEMKDEVSGVKNQVITAIRDTNQKHEEMFNRQNGRISGLFNELRQTDERVRIMQRWIWGLGGSTLLALVIILIKIFR